MLSTVCFTILTSQLSLLHASVSYVMYYFFFLDLARVRKRKMGGVGELRERDCYGQLRWIAGGKLFLQF